MEDTEAGFAYQDIFGPTDDVTRASALATLPHEQSTSTDPDGKGPLRSLIDYDDDDDLDDDETSSPSSSFSQHTLFGTCFQRGSVRLIFDVIS